MTEGLDPIPGNWYHMTEKERAGPRRRTKR